MREWIKALPLGLGLPVVIGAASIKPEDAASNLAAWLHLVGIENVPNWLAAPGVDQHVILGSLSIGAIYSFLVWGIPVLKRHSEPAKPSLMEDYQAGRWRPVYHPLESRSQSDWPIRDLFGHLRPDLPLTSKKTTGNATVDDLNPEWETVGDIVLKQLSLGNLHASGREYQRFKRLHAAPIPAAFWRTAKFTYWFLDGEGTGVLHVKNDAGKEYSDLEVSRAEALAIWPSGQSTTSLDRIPVTELMKMATDRGWDFTNHSLQLIDLQDAMRQGGADGTLTIWGKMNRYPNAVSLMRNEVIGKIPSAHWLEFRVHLFAAVIDNDNFGTYSWHIKPSSTAEKAYVDLHVERAEAAFWLSRHASAFKGKTTSNNRIG